MNEEIIENINIKKPWNIPGFYTLNAKKTGTGAFEESYEDDRYTNVLTSP